MTNLMGRATVGRFGIPNQVLADYLAAAERVAGETCPSCPHLLGDHPVRCSQCFEGRCQRGHDSSRPMCSVDNCVCGWPQ